LVDRNTRAEGKANPLDSVHDRRSMLRMTLLSGILASVVTVVVAWFMAANIQALRGADDVIVVLVLVASFAAPIALWIGSFYLFCWLLGVRR
jgi:hypothetical protein